jgi:hypothetical protein
MVAALLSGNYNSRVYDGLGDIMVVSKLITEAQIIGFGEIVLK